MTEREQVVDGERITYEGFFSFADLIKLLSEWCSTKGYWMQEKSATETVKSDGKYIEYKITPSKKVSDYAKFALSIRMIGSGLKEKEIEKDRHKQILSEGKIQIVLDGFFETDYEGNWESKPVYYVIRILWDKYIYKPFLSGFRNDLKQDVMQLKQELKAFLNLYKY